jgi:hypothetical protein
VDLFEVEVGSVSREDLQTIKVPPFGLNLERDMYFQPINAQELLSRLRQGERFEHGGVVKWQDVEVGDSARVKSENKMGVIFSTYGRKFNLKFADDSMKTYDANELEFYKDEYADGGMMGVSGEMDGQWIANTGAGMFAKGGSTQGYEIYHNTLASALREVEDYLHSEGYLFTSDKYFPDVTVGGIKYGETKRFTRPIKLQGKSKEGEVNIQIYRMDSGKYELNMYPTYANGGATDVELVENEGEAYLTSTGDSKKRMAVKLADGGIIENYRQRLENMSDSELAEEYEYETGVSKDDIMADIDDERDTYIDELVFRLKQTMRSRGEYADGGVMAKGGSVNIKSTNTSDLIKEAIMNGAEKVKVQFYPAYDEKEHSMLSEKLKDILKKGKVSIFNVKDEAYDIVQILKDPKDVKSIKWVKEKMAKGGMTKNKTTFADKVKSIKATLLKRKKVSPKVQKDYGKTYSPKEAEESAKRIAGSIRKKEMSKKKG